MLTFLEFYQTLLGFVFFKLYTDIGIAYPPPLDEDKDAAGAGVGAFVLKETTQERVSSVLKETDTAKSKASAKDVREAIKSLATVADAPADDAAPVSVIETSKSAEEDDSFVPQPSKSNPQEATALVTLKDISAIPQSSSSSLFAPYTFYLSREVSRPLFEFMIRSFGGRVGWPASSGSGSPVQESDNSVTHVIIDRPAPESGNGNQRRDRKYVQPQWVVDCINAGRILPEDAYAQGKTLPPHLSPFGEEKGAYVPLEVAEGEDVAMEGSDEDVSEDEGADADASPIAIGKVANDPESLRQAELEAEVRGVNYDAFAKEVGKAVQQSQKTGKAKDESDASEKDMNKMMMSRKQRKLYEKVKYSQSKKNSEVSRIASVLCF
jgi:pescadillo protein